MRRSVCLCFVIALWVFPEGVMAAQLAYQGTHLLTYRTMGDLAQAFRARGGFALVIRGGGCADGITAVKEGTAGMGGLCCPLKPGEGEALGFSVYPVARDIKVVLVNRKNTLETISTAAVRDLHHGRIQSWKRLGWTDRPVAVIYRVHCPDRREPVREFLGLDSGLKRLAPKTIRVDTDKQVVDYVADFPTAIGITSAAFAANPRVRSLRLDGIAPTAANVRSGRYPFASALYIATRGRATGELAQFLAFVQGPEGQQIVERRLAAKP